MNIFEVVPAVLSAMKEGEELENAATWKDRAVATNTVVALFGAALGIARAFGYTFAIDDATLAQLAAGVVALVAVANSVLHVVTDKRVGLQPKP